MRARAMIGSSLPPKSGIKSAGKIEYSVAGRLILDEVRELSDRMSDSTGSSLQAGG